MPKNKEDLEWLGQKRQHEALATGYNSKARRFDFEAEQSAAKIKPAVKQLLVTILEAILTLIGDVIRFVLFAVAIYIIY